MPIRYPQKYRSACFIFSNTGFFSLFYRELSCSFMRWIWGSVCLCPKFLVRGGELCNGHEEIKTPAMLGSLNKNGIRG